MFPSLAYPPFLLQEEWQLVRMYILQFPRLLCEAGLIKGEGLRVDSNVRKVSRKLVLVRRESSQFVGESLMSSGLGNIRLLR